jgi:hypothetical protein
MNRTWARAHQSVLIHDLVRCGIAVTFAAVGPRRRFAGGGGKTAPAAMAVTGRRRRRPDGNADLSVTGRIDAGDVRLERGAKSAWFLKS